MCIIRIPVPFENGLQLAAQRLVRRIPVKNGVVNHESHACRDGEVVAGPVRRSDVSRVVGDHVLVVVDPAEGYFLLLLS